jgi:hypothetical protein
MKQLKVLLLLTITITLSVKGQVLKGIDKYEVILGLTSTTFSGNNWHDSNKIKIGYSVGIGADWFLGKKTFLNIKFLAERKGIKFSSDTYYFDESMQQHKGRSTDITNLDYLSVPLTLQYQFKEAKTNGWSVECGPYIAYLHKAQAISEFSWRPKEMYNRKDDFNPIDFGLLLFLGYEINTNGNYSLKFWSNVNQGLTKVGKESGATGFVNVRNQAIGIGMSLIKRK